MHPMGRIVESGLQEGEKIIVNGLLRARPGMKVTPMVVDMTTLKAPGADQAVPQDIVSPAGMDSPPPADEKAFAPEQDKPAHD